MLGSIYYIGLDVHKCIIVYCVKDYAGRTLQAGEISSTRSSLQAWLLTLPGPWLGAMEATMFTGWIYDYLSSYALDLKVAHPEMLKAITSAKHKNDRLDAERIADLLRVDLLPECYIAPKAIRDLRRVLRYRNLLVRTGISLKNRMSCVLMEVGVSYNKHRLHGKRYFHELLSRLEDVPEEVLELLRLSRGGIEYFTGIQRRLLKELRENALIRDRVDLLMTIPGVGEVTALTWVLEIGEVERFSSTRKAVSYCGLCSGQHSSAGKERRGPLSKKRNHHLQTILVEAAKLAPQWNPSLASLYEHECERGHRNRATLAVARKLVAYMLAVDKSGVAFEVK